MKFLAIDPGSQHSGFVVFCTEQQKVITFGKLENNKFIDEFPNQAKENKWVVLIEKPDYIATTSFVKNGTRRSASAGREVINAIFWAGRFNQAFNNSITYGRQQLKIAFSLKNDAEVIKFIKQHYPQVKLKADSWQAFLLIHAYNNNLI